MVSAKALKYKLGDTRR